MLLLSLVPCPSFIKHLAASLYVFFFLSTFRLKAKTTFGKYILNISFFLRQWAGHGHYTFSFCANLKKHKNKTARTIYKLMNTNTNFSYPLFIPNDSVVQFYNKPFLNLFQTLFQIIIQFVSDNYLISGGKTTCSYYTSLSVTTNLLPPEAKTMSNALWAWGRSIITLSPQGIMGRAEYPPPPHETPFRMGPL